MLEGSRVQAVIGTLKLNQSRIQMSIETWHIYENYFNLGLDIALIKT